MCGSMSIDVCCVDTQGSIGVEEQVRRTALVADHYAQPIPAEWIRAASGQVHTHRRKPWRQR
jgi:hypothetical protein